ncbi:hypothetical protein M409DRAFT_60791 [Zasmidium cellare ATCC 36951]|uniref:Uncharacterized protein n=1 Tax=Zasmidium cellare ATCC 36951 TaxID=1080233 RepID=A0A6A6BXW6_ZASCE|nr:uncharacterized protein M409DRAFT_60791 [Zasmidium cellare ATCC 36951]KAF2159443.1 hypothetical protein M409DRAFT_60791 [Zasmidium cellare ATCC 36951]
MTEAREKARLDRLALEENGIFYTNDIDKLSESFRLRRSHNDVYRRAADFMTSNPLQDVIEPMVQWQYPPHVLHHKHMLLDIRTFLPTYSVEDLKKDELDDIPKRAFYDDAEYAALSRNEKHRIKERYQKLFQEARTTARKAVQLRKDRASECDWQSFLERDLFGRYHERQLSPFEKSERDSLFDTDEMCSNVQWKAPTKPSENSTWTPDLQQPKPDLYFGFPLFDFSKRPAKGLELSELSLNFSLERLKKRSLDVKFVCSPVGNLLHLSRKVPTKNRTCFPFAVVEMKHGSVDGTQRQFCYCQAANGSSRALTILERVYHIGNRHPKNHHVPAVFAFTCIGPSVMVCIKATELTSTWAVLEFHAIISNMLRWATRVHKPDLSARLSEQQLQIDEKDEMERLQKVHRKEKADLAKTIQKNEREIADLRMKLESHKDSDESSQQLESEKSCPTHTRATKRKSREEECTPAPSKRRAMDDTSQEIPNSTRAMSPDIPVTNIHKKFVRYFLSEVYDQY